MRQFLPTRSDEPMYWLMFGAGGMVASMVLPAIISLCVFGVIFLLSFYALHRMHHSSHDFGIHSKLTWYIAYGSAAAISFISLGLQLLMYVKFF